MCTHLSSCLKFIRETCLDISDSTDIVEDALINYDTQEDENENNLLPSCQNYTSLMPRTFFAFRSDDSALSRLISCITRGSDKSTPENEVSRFIGVDTNTKCSYFNELLATSNRYAKNNSSYKDAWIN